MQYINWNIYKKRADQQNGKTQHWMQLWQSDFRRPLLYMELSCKIHSSFASDRKQTGGRLRTQKVKQIRQSAENLRLGLGKHRRLDVCRLNSRGSLRAHRAPAARRCHWHLPIYSKLLNPAWHVPIPQRRRRKAEVLTQNLQVYCHRTCPGVAPTSKTTFASTVTESLLFFLFFFAAALDGLFNRFPIDPGALRSAKLISNIHTHLLTSSPSSVLIKGSSLSGMKAFFGGWASPNSKILLPQPGTSDAAQRARLFAEHQHWRLLRGNELQCGEATERVFFFFF